MSDISIALKTPLTLMGFIGLPPWSVVLADKIAQHAVLFFPWKSVTESPEGTTNAEVDLALGKS